MTGYFGGWLLQVPADRVTPVILWLVGLRPALADGEFTGAAVINILAASIAVHIVQAAN